MCCFSLVRTETHWMPFTSSVVFSGTEAVTSHETILSLMYQCMAISSLSVGWDKVSSDQSPTSYIMCQVWQLIVALTTNQRPEKWHDKNNNKKNKHTYSCLLVISILTDYFTHNSLLHGFGQEYTVMGKWHLRRTFVLPRSSLKTKCFLWAWHLFGCFSKSKFTVLNHHWWDWSDSTGVSLTFSFYNLTVC